MIIGIDLGTTNSAVAVWEGGEARIVPNALGNRVTPSVVAFTGNGEVLVGESARNQVVLHSDRTVIRVKRAMGTETVFTIDGVAYSPEQISAEILKKLKQDAEAYLEETVTQAVITVPAHFNDARRKATKEAGRLAGLKVLRIINEPTAAALAVSAGGEFSEKIVVYDLGGGTFDVTCLERNGTEFRVLASDGDSFLGGIEFDRALTRLVLKHFEAESGVALGRDPVVMQMLSDLVERAKIELSSRTSATIGIPFLHGRGAPVHLIYTADRSEFEILIEPYIHRTLEKTHAMIKAAGWRAGEIDLLVFSGGSSRIPSVRTRMGSELDIREASRVNPDEMVALGAAVQARIIAQGGSKRLRDVSPTDLGVEIENDQVSILIPRNSRLPASAKRIFTTIADRQNLVEIHVLEGDRPRASQNASLGRFVLAGIREGGRGEPRIEVEFLVDEDGILGVEALHIDTRAGERIVVVPTRDHSGESRADAAARLRSLVRRVAVLTEQDSSTMDLEFETEIREITAIAELAAVSGDPERLREAELALLTVLEELHLMYQIAEAENAGA